ncbi:hypothetical protein [Novosphingobium sp. Rr 2-17]|uniref:hypothetical protein n=1 Tax=Novosphingobium sp. Rr 2-17 TaxID=555793 RepID=UPI00178C34D3
MVRQVLKGGQIFHRQIDDAHEYPHGKLFGELMREIAAAIFLKAVNQADRQVNDHLLHRLQWLGTEILIQQVAERAVLWRIQRQRNQAIGLARRILGHQDGVVGKALEIRHHRI